MPDGPGGFAQGFSCPALLRVTRAIRTLRIRGCHPLRPPFPGRSPRVRHAVPRPYNPGRAHKDGARFGLVPVRSPLLGESLLFSLPGGTKMFQFPPLASRAFARDVRPSGGRVVPFGHPRVNGRLHLAVDFRSLPRPSSPPRAKASAMRPLSLPCITAWPLGRRERGRVALQMYCLLILLLRCLTLSPAQNRAGQICLLQSCLSIMPKISRPQSGKVENNGFEPLTPCLQSRCSSQLS